MIHVFPDRPRSRPGRFLMAPLVFLQILWLHPANGPGYAWEWTGRSLAPLPLPPIIGF